MATQTTIVYNATALVGKDLSKSITNVNQEAGAGVLENFATGINALTTNVYKDAFRIDKTNLDEGGEPVTPTLTLGESTVTHAQLLAACETAPFSYLVDINYNGDGKLSVDNPVRTDESNFYKIAAKIVYVNGAPKLKIIFGQYAAAEDGSPRLDIIVSASATDNFAAATATLNIREN